MYGIEGAIKKKAKMRESMLGKNQGSRSIEERKNIGIATRLARIKEIKEKLGQSCPNYNPKACEYFNLLMEETNTFIQHAQNGGEFSILGYFVDGYDKINNIVYEYDESFHYKNGELNKKDIKRQKEITEHLNCKFIRIKESEVMNKKIMEEI